MIDDTADDPRQQIIAGVVTTCTLLVGFGLLFAGVSYFWVAFPVGFGGVLPMALGAARLYQHRQETTSDEDDDPIDTLQRRYAQGEITEAEFERQVEQLLETNGKASNEQVRRDRERDRN